MTNGFGKIDLHMHSTVSDGTDTPAQLFDNVRAAGLEVFSVTDHDSVKAAFAIRGLLSDGDPLFIPGVEFSCRDEEGKYHILGYGFDPMGAAIRGVVEMGHAIRMRKLRARLDFLRSEFGFSFPDEAIKALMALDNPGKPHLGNLLVQYGFAATMVQAIKDYVNQARVKSEHVSPRQAIEGILGAGGIPVLAHPFYGSGDELIIGEEMEMRLERLVGFGLRGIEAFYSGFTEKLCSSALSLAERYDLYVTAGSDYHGTNKMVTLGDTGPFTGTQYPERLNGFLKAVLK